MASGAWLGSDRFKKQMNFLWNLSPHYSVFLPSVKISMLLNRNFLLVP